MAERKIVLSACFGFNSNWGAEAFFPLPFSEWSEFVAFDARLYHKLRQSGFSQSIAALEFIPCHNTGFYITRFKNRNRK